MKKSSRNNSLKKIRTVRDLVDDFNERRVSRELLDEYKSSFNITGVNEHSAPQAQDPNRRDKLIGSMQSHRMTDSMRMKRDEHDMARVAADAGINVFGCVFLEVWVLNEDRTRIVRKGAWMDPAFRVSLPDNALEKEAKYLINEAPDTAIGVGLAGTIFAEKKSQRVVQWRQIRSIMTDPFKQRDPNERTVRIFSLGIGWVACTTFSFGVDSGIVLFYIRSTNIIDKKSAENERAILDYTDFIGSTFAVIKTREKCIQMRRQMLSDAVRKVRSEIVKKYSAAGVSLDRLGSAILDKEKMATLKATLAMAPEEEVVIERGDTVRELMKKFRKRIRRAYRMAAVRVKSSPRKWSGVHLHGPPRHTLTGSIEAFVWVFVTMLMILKMSTSISPHETFAFDGSWYSSTLCILFALTPAPVGQPRQIIAAHLWNMIIGLLIRLIPTGDVIDFMEWRLVRSSDYGMPLIWKQALAVSLGVSGQAYFGILHPPATGLSLAFATNEIWSWGTMLAVLVTDAAVILLSVLMINLSEKGQYPLWWVGFGWENSGVNLTTMAAKTTRWTRSKVLVKSNSMNPSSKTDENENDECDQERV